jgi:hypothetical protein
MALATVGAAVMPERDMLDGPRNNPGMATASAQWQADLELNAKTGKRARTNRSLHAVSSVEIGEVASVDRARDQGAALQSNYPKYLRNPPNKLQFSSLIRRPIHGLRSLLINENPMRHRFDSRWFDTGTGSPAGSPDVAGPKCGQLGQLQRGAGST